jgi:phosphatidylglycerophosphatase A
MRIQTLFVTFFGTGFSPKAPDTLAPLAALLLGSAVLHYLGMETLFMLAFGVTVIGIFEINKYTNGSEEECRRKIVIDKAAGVWLSLMIASSTAATMHYPYAEILAVALGFAAFRLFDSWKPSTIGWLEREVKGGLGIMLSALLAGMAGGLLGVVVLKGIQSVM